MNVQVVNFSNHELRVIENQAQKWFCARDIAKALEFKNPDADVCNVYRRNKSEFDETMTCTCKLQVQGQTKTVRLYNREGAWLIGMFARTPKAAEFRKWVLKVLGAVADGQSDKTVIVSEHIRSLPSGKKEIVLSEKAKTEIGGIVKSVLQAEITQRENIRDVIREVIREEIAPYLLKDGIKEGTFNTSPTADGLPAVNWVIGISHGATALYNLIQQYQKCLREKNDLLLSENADLKNRMKQISSWVR